eukprot:gene16085-21848_t
MKKYPEEFKKRTVLLLDNFDSAHKLCSFLVNYNPATCDKLTPKTILRWKKKFDESSSNNNKKKKTIDRPYCEEFDKEVFDECIFVQVRGANGDEQELVVTANVAYSYEVIRQCACNVHNRAYATKIGKQLSIINKWKEHPLTKHLKFTNKWIWGVLRRNNLRRRRVTTSLKKEPSEEEVNQHMENEIHSVILEHNLAAHQIFNEDETGIHWAEEIKYQFVPKNAKRAAGPPGDEKGRFTAMLGSNGVGDMLPVFLIVKVDCKSEKDLTSSRVLNKFHTINGVCDPTKGWVKRTFEKMHPDKQGNLCSDIIDDNDYYSINDNYDNTGDQHNYAILANNSDNLTSISSITFQSPPPPSSYFNVSIYDYKCPVEDRFYTIPQKGDGDEVLNNSNKYYNFIVGSIEDYVNKNIRKNFQWADEVEIWASESIWKRPILIYNTDGSLKREPHATSSQNTSNDFCC